MSRTADKPGTWRVRPKGGMFLLSGVRDNGSRFKLELTSAEEAQAMGIKVFGSPPVHVPTLTLPKEADALDVDEFGLPRAYSLPKVSAETIAVMAPAVNAAGGPTMLPRLDPDAAAKKEEIRLKKAKQAKSVAEMLGIAWVSADIWVARRFLESRYEEVPKPNVKQNNDLADAVKDAMAESFGDREIGKWTFVFLMTIGIPLSMWLQSRKPIERKKTEAVLKSVP